MKTVLICDIVHADRPLQKERDTMLNMNWFRMLRTVFFKPRIPSQVVEAPKPEAKPEAKPKPKLQLVSRFEYGDRLWTKKEWKQKKRMRQLAKYNRLINSMKGC